MKTIAGIPQTIAGIVCVHKKYSVLLRCVASYGTIVR